MILLTFSLAVVALVVCSENARRLLTGVRNELGIHELCRAAFAGRNSEIRLLLRMGVPIYFSEDDFAEYPNLVEQASPIWCAARGGNSEGLKIFLAHGGAYLVDRQECCTGGTPLGAALYEKHYEVAKILKDAGATIDVRPF